MAHSDYMTLDKSGLIVVKEWVTEFQKVRDTHIELHGTVVGQNDNFNVGGYSAQYPKDPNSLCSREM